MPFKPLRRIYSEYVDIEGSRLRKRFAFLFVGVVLILGAAVGSIFYLKSQRGFVFFRVKEQRRFRLLVKSI